jgi:hypothetical protein
VVIFKAGDKVRIKPGQRKELKARYRKDAGTVIIEQCTNRKQWCRVQFGNSTLDYEDYGSWRLELV